MKFAIGSTPSPLFKLENHRPFSLHSHCIGRHYRKVSPYERSQTDSVNHQKIGSRDSRTAFSRNRFAFHNDDDVDRYVCRFGAEGAARLSAPDSTRHSTAIGNFFFIPGLRRGSSKHLHGLPSVDSFLSPFPQSAQQASLSGRCDCVDAIARTGPSIAPHNRRVLSASPETSATLHLLLARASTVSGVERHPESRLFMSNIIGQLFSVATVTRFAQPHPLPWQGRSKRQRTPGSGLQIIRTSLIPSRPLQHLQYCCFAV
jgi:hypothetical protein